MPGGWQSEDQYFTWYEADQKVKWDSAKHLLAEVAENRPDFKGLETGLSTVLSTQSYRHLKKSSARVDEKSRSAVNAALGGVWHEERTHRAFSVGNICAPIGIRKDAEFPADEETVPPCVKLYGLLPAPRLPAIITHEPAVVYRANIATVWTDGSGKHSSDLHHRRCGVAYYTLTRKNVSGYLYQASSNPFLEECQPHEVVSDCKGVVKLTVKAVQALQTGHRTPKGCNRDLEKRVLAAFLPGQRIRWMKAHLTQVDVDSGRITARPCTADRNQLQLGSVGLTLL
eukprot:1002665-Amphidinium_carterae.2